MYAKHSREPCFQRVTWPANSSSQRLSKELHDCMADNFQIASSNNDIRATAAAKINTFPLRIS